MIIQRDIANLPPDSTTTEILVRAEELVKGLPIHLKIPFALHAPPSRDTQSFEIDLMREIRDLPLNERLEAKEISI